MEPTNYITQVQTPFQNAIIGAQTGLQFGAAAEQAQAKQLQLQQAQAAQSQQLQMQRDLNELANNKSATGADYARVMTAYPQLSEHLSKALSANTQAQTENVINDASQVFAALHSGKPEIAQQVLTEKAQAYRNSGDEQRAKGLDAINKSISINPQSAQTSIGMLLGHAMGPEKFGSMISAIGKEGRETELFPSQKTEAEAKAQTAGSEAQIKAAEAGNVYKKLGLENANTESQIRERSQRLGLDRDKLKSEVQLKLYELGLQSAKLPEYVAKDVSAAATEAISSQQSAQQMLATAEKIDAASKDLGGSTAKLGELWKRTFSSQDELTRIRSEYARIVTPAAMAAYKKVASGSTSDKDIETAMIGVPSDTARPETMASFLRGAAKLQQYDSAMNTAKTDWLTNVQHLGKAKTDVEIDGVKVPAGTTFKQFVDQFINKKFAPTQERQTDNGNLSQRSYMSVVK